MKLRNLQGFYGCLDPDLTHNAGIYRKPYQGSCYSFKHTHGAWTWVVLQIRVVGVLYILENYPYPVQRLLGFGVWVWRRWTEGPTVVGFSYALCM